MDAAAFFSLLRRWWWLPLLGSIMAVAAYGIATLVQGRADDPPTYRATATLVVSLRDGDAPLPAGTVDRPWDLDRLMSTYAKLIESDAVAQRAASELGAPDRARHVARSIDVSTPGYTQLLYVDVTATSPDAAEQLAGATAWAFGAIREERRLPGKATLLGVSDIREVPSDDTPALLALLLVAMAGAGAATALVLGFEYLGGNLRDARDAETATGAPVLASLAPDAPRAVVMHEACVAAERYRMLRTAFGIATVDDPAQVLLVTEPQDGRGASAVAANFALAAAQSGRSVALVDADLRTPELQYMLGVTPGAGLAQALADDFELDTATMPSQPGIALIGAGGTPPNPSELLDSARFDRLLGELRERFDLIVIASPPALVFTDAIAVATRCDAAIVAVCADRTTRDDASACVDTLRRAGSRVLGLVLLDDPYAPGERAFDLTRAASAALSKAAAR
jgi:capsular exopolysaccharide synthesis family protein